jgi:hypothetical protein
MPNAAAVAAVALAAATTVLIHARLGGGATGKKNRTFATTWMHSV